MRKSCLPFWGEGGVLLEVAQDTAQTSWLLLEQAELGCCQCPCSFPLSWLQVLPRVICSSQPVQPCMECRMLWWCNPSLVQNKFPLEQAEFSPGFERLFLNKPWKLNTYSESSFPWGVWIPPAPQHGLSLPPAPGCAVFPSGKHPSHPADSPMRESLNKMSSGKQTT